MTIVLAAGNSSSKRRWRAVIESAGLNVLECADLGSARFGAGPAVLLADARFLVASKKILAALRAKRPDIIVLAFGDEKSLYGDLGGALALGAADFLSDALPEEELKNRLRGHCRSEGGRASLLLSPDKSLRLDCARREASILARGHWKPLAELTPKEYDLLHLFLLHPGTEFSREQLLKEVWGDSLKSHPEAVDKQVGALRRKLGARRKCIATLRGVGYRFF